MSIAALGGISPHGALAPAGGIRRPESAEVPGAPDRDGDSDDVRTSPAQPSSRSVDLHA
jgi:hypothetical protein